MKKVIFCILLLALLISFPVSAHMTGSKVIDAKKVSYVCTKEEIKLSSGETYVTKTDYDSNGNIIKETVTDKFSSGHDNHYYTCSYDSKGNISKKTIAKTETSKQIVSESAKYDSKGYITSKVVNNRNGSKEEHTYNYDSKGLLTRKIVTIDESYIELTIYTYDANGNMTKESYSDTYGGEYVNTYTYDSYNRVTKKVNKVKKITNTETFAYDKNGNVIKNTYSGPNLSFTQSYKFDSNNKLLSDIYSSTNSKHNYTYAYDELGNLVSENIKEDTYESMAKYTYDGPRLAKLNITGTETSVTSYSYDKNGNLIKEVTSYPDDTKATRSYTYDANGNITKDSFKNEFGEVTTYSYTFDGNGNVTKKEITECDGSKTTFTYEYKKLSGTRYENDIFSFVYKEKVNYTGKAVIPEVYVRDNAKGSIDDAYAIFDVRSDALRKGIDYVVKSSNNINAGKTYMTIEFIGQYSDYETVKLPFTIVDDQIMGLKASSIKPTSVVLSWSGFKGAKTYKVEKSLDGKTFDLVKNTSDVSLTISSLKASTAYYFRVTGYDSSGKVKGKTSDKLKVTTGPAAPKVTKTTATTITLELAKVTNAAKYKVEVSTDGSTWKSAGTFTSNVATIKDLSAGTKYQFRARAYNSANTVLSSVSLVCKAETLCVAPTIKLSSTASKTATVEITKVKGASKYVVAISTDNKTWKKLSPTTSTKYTIKDLAGGKKIYVKVQALNSLGLASSYSPVLSVTVKK